jgi:bifunctional DNase/RNase
VEIDSRPSDAIAIALRFGAPLFAREALLEDSVEVDEDDAGQAIDFEGPNWLGPPQATRRASRPERLDNTTLIKRATCVEHASAFLLRRELDVGF